MRSGVGLRSDMGSSVMRRHVRSSTIRSSDWSAVMHWNSCMGLGLLRMTVRLSIGIGRYVLRPSLVAPRIVLAVAIVAAGGVRHVRDHLHSPGDSACRTTATGSVC